MFVKLLITNDDALPSHRDSLLPEFCEHEDSQEGTKYITLVYYKCLVDHLTCEEDFNSIIRLLQSHLEVVVRGLEVLSILPEADAIHKELADVLEVQRVRLIKN